MSLHQSLSAENKRVLILSLVATAILSLVPISSHATVDWSEGFEYADDTSFGAVWPHSCLGNPGVSTLRPFSGSKSLRLVFNGHAGVDPGAGGCFIDRNLNGPSDTLYVRYYMYLENFAVDAAVGTKMTLQGEQCCYPSFWWLLPFGGPTLSVAVQGVILNNGTQDTETLFGGTISQNQWACIETRTTMSAPGVDNGIVQAWINGTQVINKTTQRMRSATLNQGNSPTTQHRFVRLYTQHGRGVIYYDDYAVSRDARIGCSGSSTPASYTDLPPILWTPG